ncbi:MAG: helix-turn-helix domain-containing protein [Methanomassiliicoccaceae archaeon]|nr:helix-turn-helix domain-containing protein [Methanomassiliicoccaceae archaeon]
MADRELIMGMLREGGGFQKALRRVLSDDLGMTVNEFCQATKISQSTMYKLLEEKREPNLRTIRVIVKAVRFLMAKPEERFIAVIASRQFLSSLTGNEIVNDRNVNIREYPVSTIEDAIISAVIAERDGALGVVCAPMVATTVEKILEIPISPVIPMNSMFKAIEKLLEEI